MKFDDMLDGGAGESMQRLSRGRAGRAGAAANLRAERAAGYGTRMLALEHSGRPGRDRHCGPWHWLGNRASSHRSLHSIILRPRRKLRKEPTEADCIE